MIMIIFMVPLLLIFAMGIYSLVLFFMIDEELEERGNDVVGPQDP